MNRKSETKSDCYAETKVIPNRNLLKYSDFPPIICQMWKEVKVFLDKLIAIMNTLECSADDIFEDVITSGYKNKESKLSDKIEKLSDKNKMLIFDVLDTLLNNLE